MLVAHLLEAIARSYVSAANAFQSAALIVSCLVVCPRNTDAAPQQSELLPSHTVNLDYDTGEVWNYTGTRKVVASFPVQISGAEWIRLYFGEVEIGTALLRVTAYKDGEVQELTSLHCEQWANSTGYFNGSTVQVDIEAPPHSGPFRISVSQAIVGEAVSIPENQCGLMNDRVPFNDPRVARMFNGGAVCTAWIVEDCSRCMLSAGHCLNPANIGANVVHFNVPASMPNGAPVMSAMNDQYAVDPASMPSTHWEDNGFGNDWAYFGANANPNTGLTPGDVQFTAFKLDASMPVVGGTVKAIGHGVDAAERNRVQQISSGPIVAVLGDAIDYQADTETGNSGSPIVGFNSDRAIGVHTNGGCVASVPTTGANGGTSIRQAGLAWALSHPAGVCRPPTLRATDAVAGDKLGLALAAGGDSVVLGARFKSDSGSSSGAAYVFAGGSSNWAQSAKLTASDAAAGAQFGGSVSRSGDSVLIGAEGVSGPSGSNIGAAYVFVRSGTGWSQQARLQSTDGAPGDHFGAAVGLYADTAVIGVPDDDEGATNSGSIYIFTRSGGVWAQRAKLLASTATPNGHVGKSIAVSGNTAVAGADNIAGGAAYVFVGAGANWVQQAKLLASDLQPGDSFGWSVAVSGDTILVGSPGQDALGSSSGAVYVFVRTGTTWVQQAKILSGDGAAGDNFGQSVALGGSVALVGAPNVGVFNSGAAYLYSQTGGVWAQEERLMASTSAQFDRFGSAVALVGDRAFVSAPWASDLISNAGCGYTFRTAVQQASIYCDAKLNSKGCLPAIRFAGVFGVTESSPFNVTATSVVSNKSGLFLVSTAGAGSVAKWGGTLCVRQPIRRTPLQNSAGHIGVDDCSGVLAIDLNDWFRSNPSGAPLAGEAVYVQCWYRDPGSTFGIGLTNAVEATLLP